MKTSPSLLRSLQLSLLLSLSLSLPSLAAILLDGTRDSEYGAPLAVQTVQTQFGDNLSELDAAYALIDDGHLFLFLSGNLESNFNKLNIFIDSVAGGQNVIGGTNPTNDGWASKYNGFTFDAGFEADYLLIARNGSFNGNRFDFDFAVLGTATSEAHSDLFGGSFTGSSSPLGAARIQVAYNSFNTAGVTGGTGPADQVAAAAVTTGIEIKIPLGAIGNPSGPIRVSAMVNGSNHDFLSNQFLGGLTAPQSNLGGDGFGTFTGSVSGINLNSFAGEQFFTVLAGDDGPRLAGVSLNAAETQIELTVTNLTVGQSYRFLESSTLDGFLDIAGSQFTAAATTETRTLPVDPGVEPDRFFVVTSAP